MLISVTHYESYRASCRLALEHPAKQFNLVGLVARCGYGALSWTAAIKLALDELQVDIYAGRHAVYYTSHSLSVTLAKRCKPENLSETIH